MSGVWVWVVCSAVMLAGCSGNDAGGGGSKKESKSFAEEYCEKACDCIDCAAADLDQCVDDVNDARQQAQEMGCGAEYEALADCVDAVDDVCEASADECEDENEDLADCAGQ